MTREGPYEIEEILPMTPITNDLYNRAIPSMTFYNPEYDREPLPDYMSDEDWFLFVQRMDGKFEVMKGMAGESAYFGSEPADSEKDVYIEFINLYIQHLSWPRIIGIFPGLIEDIRNISASLSKLAIYQHIRQPRSIGIERLVRTELEHLFMTCRSFYDLFQFIASNTWSFLEYEDGRGTVDLPTTFSSIALHNDEPREASDISDAYDLPGELAEFYADEGKFFSNLKLVRDNVNHNGASFGRLFLPEDGFSVDPESELFSNFDVWDSDQLNDNGIAPFWPFPAYIIDRTLSVMQKFLSSLLSESLVVPPHLVPEYNYYLRGEHVRNLGRIEALKHEDASGSQFVEDVANQLGLTAST